MEPYQERVIEEKKELDAKIVKLAALTSNPFGQQWVYLAEEERGRLRRQLSIMCQYSVVLEERIRAFSQTYSEVKL